MRAWLFLSILGSVVGQDDGKAALCKASIVCQSLPSNQLEVQVQCQNNSADMHRVRYELKMHKQGPAGTSSNQQSGWSELLAGQQKIVSNLRFNTQPADVYQIKLRLYNEQGQLLSQDSVAHPVFRK